MILKMFTAVCEFLHVKFAVCERLLLTTIFFFFSVTHFWSDFLNENFPFVLQLGRKNRGGPLSFKGEWDGLIMTFL